MDDEAILALYRQRQSSAITETDAKYGRLCFSVANNILNNREDSEECVNDTWLHAWNAIPPEWPKKLSAWLSRVTRNLAVSRFRAEHAAKRGGDELPLILDELAECIADRDNGEDFADQIALRDALNSFLRKLSPEARTVFIRRYWHVQSIDEIAKACGMSVSKVKSMLMRTRNRLKKALTEEGFFG